MKRWFECAVYVLLDALLFAAIRSMLIEATFSEVRARAYHRPYEPPSYRISPSQARFLYEEQKDRDQQLYDKVKQLLILTSAAAAYLNKDSPHAVLTLLSTPLLLVILICAADLSIRFVSVPDYSDIDRDPSERQWALDLSKATHENRQRSAFRADLYRAALRWLVLGFFVIVSAAAAQAGRSGSVPYETVNNKCTSCHSSLIYANSKRQQKSPNLRRSSSRSREWQVIFIKPRHSAVMRGAGFVPAGFDRNRLRSETVALAALSIAAGIVDELERES
jgi:hypothetical protein